MKKIGIGIFAAAFLTAAAALAAQATTSLTLSTDDATKLKDWATRQTANLVAPAPAGLNVAVGSVVPDTVMLYDVTAVGVATITKYRYAKIGDKIVLVDPMDKKIVYVVA
jgi:hypothetical protein